MLNKIPLFTLYPNEQYLLQKVLKYTADKFSFKENEPADFADTLFVLPTREAGRLFREKAAIFFSDRGGVIQLNTILPEQLLFRNSDINCNEAVQLNSWFEILKESSSDTTQLLKSDIEYSDESLFAIAELCMRTRENIRLESSLNTADFLNSLDDETLKNKITDFKTAEEKYLAKINPLKDKASVIEDTFADPMKNLQEIKNIILIECTELKNSIVNLLEKISDLINVEICLNISENEWQNYDHAGRPITDLILKQEINYFPEDTFRAYSSPLQEAMKITSLLEKDNLPESIGVLDSDLASPLTHLLAEKNIEVYTPRQQGLNSFYWYKLFNALLELRQKHIPFEKVYDWASDESFAAYANFDSVQVRTDIEKLQRKHLIQDFESLKFFCRSENAENTDTPCCQSLNFCNALENLQKEIISVNSSALPEGIWFVFEKIAQCNPLNNMDIDSAESSLEALKKIIVDLRKIKTQGSKTALFKHMVNNTNIHDAEVFKDNAVNFSGFLDLIWYENKSLIIGGMTEKSFNTGTTDDIFFPDQIRKKLNWSSAWSRFGADIHRFAMLCDQYPAENLFITYSNTDTAGQLNTLPRLLFLVRDSFFPHYCDMFFNNHLAEKILPENDSQNDGLKYAPFFRGKMPEKISVTSFKKYISCPYTFYLSDVMKFQDQGEELFELQPYQNGDIIHNVLEEYGKKFQTTIPDEDTLTSFINLEFEKQLRRQIGFSINNIALMQCAEIKKSLNSFIKHEIEYRQSFKQHEIIHTEIKLNVTFGELLSRLPDSFIQDMPPADGILKNIAIVGKIDRIDLAVDKDGNQFCHIIDYKTAKNPVSPFNAHITKKCPDHLDKKSMTAIQDDNNMYFCDMQLVIYKLMTQFMREKFNIAQNIPIKCGYFNLPEDTSRTGISFFDELDDCCLTKGAYTLNYLMNEIFVSKNFWPPSCDSKYSIVQNYFANCKENDFVSGKEEIYE